MQNLVYRPFRYVIYPIYFTITFLLIFFLIKETTSNYNVDKIIPYTYYKTIHGKQIKFTTYTLEVSNGSKKMTINDPVRTDWKWCDEHKGDCNGRPKYTISSDSYYNKDKHIEEYNKLIKDRIYTYDDEIPTFLTMLLLILFGVLIFFTEYFYYSNIEENEPNLKLNHQKVYNLAVFLGFPKEKVQEFLNEYYFTSFRDFLSWYKEHK